MNVLKKLSLIAFLLKVVYDYGNGVYFNTVIVIVQEPNHDDMLTCEQFFGAFWVGIVALYLYLFVSNGMNFGESSTNRFVFPLDSMPPDWLANKDFTESKSTAL